jgi:exodeoxyribonuclease VII small subunit
MASPGSDEELVSFEAALAELEDIVAQLESGKLPLAESLDRYERGVRRLRQCHALLEAAEKRIALLALDDQGRLVERPLNADDARGPLDAR